MWLKLAYDINFDEQVMSYAQNYQPKDGNIIRKSIHIPDSLLYIFNIIDNNGGRALIVGGAIRDAALNIPVKDIDIEVYGLSYDDLVNLLNASLESNWRIDIVGQQFSVVKVINRNNINENYDLALPRRDNKMGVKHTDFQVSSDPDLHPAVACARRDFTFNSMAYDPTDDVLYDFFCGIDDLNNGILRATSTVFQDIQYENDDKIDISHSPFAEDALRVLRGMQFCARFGLRVERATALLCNAMKEEIGFISRERIEDEWVKFAGKGIKPSKGLIFLNDIGWEDIFPGIFDKQFEQRCHFIDMVASSSKELPYLDRANSVIASLSNSSDTFKGMGFQGKKVSQLVKLHSALHRISQDKHISENEIRRALNDVGLDHTILLPLIQARYPDIDVRPIVDENIEISQKPLLNGNEILEILNNYGIGIEPGPQLGKIIKQLMDEQINGNLKSKEDASNWLISGKYIL